MTCDVMYKGFDIEVAIIPPAGLVLGDVRMYAQSPRGKRAAFQRLGGRNFVQSSLSLIAQNWLLALESMHNDYQSAGWPKIYGEE